MDIIGWILNIFYTVFGIYPNDVDLAVWWLSSNYDSRQYDDDYEDDFDYDHNYENDYEDYEAW